VVAAVIGPLAPGTAFAAEAVNFPAGIPDLVGARIVAVGTGIEVAPWKGNPVEIEPGDYQLGLTAPSLPGRYSILWDCAGGAPTRESQVAQEDLEVEAVPPAGATAGVGNSGGPTVTVPQFSMPFRFVDGKAVVVEQDSIEEIRDCVANVCRYQPGDRPARPAFGIPDQAFAQNGPDVGLLTASVTLWEPRAVLAAQLEGSDLEELVASVVVNVTDQGGAS
jgi:hypothetical protein